MPEMTLLERVLEPGNLYVHVQPIVAIDGAAPRIHAVECLIRGPRGTNLESPDILFEYARRKHEEAAVDRTCVKTVIEAAASLPQTLGLHVNVHASTLARDSGFIRYLVGVAGDNGVELERLTIEIVEHAPPWDVPHFSAALSEARSYGFQIALDDIGLGHSNFRMIIDCSPDCFKVDRYFVTDAQNDEHRRAVLESIGWLAQKFGANVVAEGVETEAELEIVREAGIGLVQGWLFSRAFPVEDWQERYPEMSKAVA